VVKIPSLPVAGCDQVSVNHQWLIYIVRTGINHVLADGDEARSLLTLEQIAFIKTVVRGKRQQPVSFLLYSPVQNLLY